jgi:hypothetical protein
MQQITNKSKFELAKEQVNQGTLKAPKVSYGGTEINFFDYQLSVHRFQLGVLSTGMKMRGLRLKDIKSYYNLTGKSAQICLEQLDLIILTYKNCN